MLSYAGRTVQLSRLLEETPGVREVLHFNIMSNPALVHSRKDGLAYFDPEEELLQHLSRDRISTSEFKQQRIGI